MKINKKYNLLIFKILLVLLKLKETATTTRCTQHWVNMANYNPLHFQQLTETKSSPICSLSGAVLSGLICWELISLWHSGGKTWCLI